jgi:acyl-CoA synthetase (NDP forming)/GNAT superfamily N-acetyltransferase
MSQPLAAITGVYALLADGATVQIRPTAPGDFEAVKAMHEAMSPSNAYLRFFSLSRTAAEREARRICRAPSPDHAALLALYGAEVVGVASYEVARDTTRKATGDAIHGTAGDAAGNVAEDADLAEVAFAVADSMHHRGIATLLLEHLVSIARGRGIRAFTAETLSENADMLRVFSAAGLPARSTREDGVVTFTIPLPPDDTGKELDEYLDTVALRERSANVASLRPIFDPKSVVVVGASRRQGTVGRSVLDNIKSCGYQGCLYAVNPHTRQIGGVPSFPDVASLPEAPDIALIAVPPLEVLAAAEDCGRRGVRGLVVLTADLDTAASADLLAACRRHGMRLIGPNCFGIAVPAIGLDATFAAAHPVAGVAGLVMQSGGLGFAMVDHLSRLGIGISSFASVGSKLDVSSNDMLMWWEQDRTTKLAVLYIESFGSPRKFARTARRVGAHLPVLTVHAGRSEAGQRAAASHTAAVATSLVSREALFEQAGIIATPSFGELVETTAMLATQPPPTGRTVAIVSNVGGAGVLAADACTDLGLDVHHPRGLSQRRLRGLMPEGCAVSGPVDTTATVSREQFRQVLELLSTDEDVDAMIALVLPTAATGDLVAAISDATVTVPFAAVVLHQPEAVRLLDSPGGKIPTYGYPEAAAAALARAAKYGQWRSSPHGQVPRFPDLAGPAVAEARALVRAFLAKSPDGGWLPPDQVAALLRGYGIPLRAAAEAHTEAHTAEGIELIIRVQDDQMFGPLVVFGLGGVATEVLADRVARLAPLTEPDADTLINSIRSAPLLHARRGAPTADLAALRDALMRVSRLADDLPEITDLDLNPVIARPDGVVAVGARIKVAPQPPQDPFLRRLR